MKKEFEIGDRVSLVEFDKVPDEERSPAVAKLCGKSGTVIDKLFSDLVGKFLYIVHFDGYPKASSKMWEGACLEAHREPSKEYKVVVEIAENVVVVVLTEDGKEIHRNHGHILHEGIPGVVQATSYALKKIRDRIGGGNW